MLFHLHAFEISKSFQQVNNIDTRTAAACDAVPLPHTCGIEMLHNNPWRSDVSTFPRQASSLKGLKHVLSSSESLGLGSTAPLNTSGAQIFSEAVSHYTKVGQDCAAHEVS